MRREWLHIGAILAVFLAVLFVPDISWAASGDSYESQFQSNVIDFGSSINSTSFQSTMLSFYLGMKDVFKSIIVILTVASGAMVLFGIEDGKKTMWQFMLGIGLAINFGGALYEIFEGTGLLGQSVDQVAMSAKGTNATAEILKNSAQNGNDDILTEIMAYYSGTIINKSIPVLTAIAVRMTLVLAAIESGYKLAVDLVRGDKIHFLVSVVFKVGFFLFLITNWLSIGQALSGFFQAAGFMAGGELDFDTSDPTAADDGKAFRPDSIMHNAIAMFNIIMFGNEDAGAKATAGGAGIGFATAVGGGLLSMGTGISLLAGLGWVPLLLTVLFLVFIVGLLLFTSIEMFIARIEFYTFLMLSVVFLPFGVTERLSFLSNSAISLVFNSGAKMMVIAFLQVMIASMLSTYLSKLVENPIGNFSVLFQMLIMSAFFAYITKKIPDLASAFLNGSPALSGGGFMNQAKTMAAKTATVVATGTGAVAGASAVSAGNAAAAGTGKISQLKNTLGTLGRAGAQNVLARNPVTRGYASGVTGVVGNDGSLQNESFRTGVARLAGLTKFDDKDGEHKSVTDIAAGKVKNVSSVSGGSGGGGSTGVNPNAPQFNTPGSGTKEKVKEQTSTKESTVVEKTGGEAKNVAYTPGGGGGSSASNSTINNQNTVNNISSKTQVNNSNTDNKTGGPMSGLNKNPKT